MVTTTAPRSSFLGTLALALDDRTDERLLAAFYSQRDETAFATLVRRHQRTVWNVCRRVLQNTTDAEDAFQATFIVLAQSGKSLADRGSIGGWLYRVAYRVAQKARAKVNKRRQKEQVAARSESTTAPQPDHHDVLAIIGEELDRLTEDQRLAVIVCDLDGLSRAEAAKRLGWNEGTLSTRLHRGRKKLAERLKLRGVTAPLVGIGAIFGNCGVVSAKVVADTIRVAPLALLGGSSHTAVSTSVTALVSEITREMTVRITTKILGSLVLVAGMLGTSWMGVSIPLEQKAVAAPVPEKKDEAKKAKATEAEVHLLRNRHVLRELKCTPEQRVTIDDHFADYAEKMAAKKTDQVLLLDVQGVNFNQLQEHVESQIQAQVKQSNELAHAEALTVVEKVLKPAQFARLTQIELQVGGASSLTTDKVVGALKLTDEQKKTITEIVEEAMRPNPNNADVGVGAARGGVPRVAGVPIVVDRRAISPVSSLDPEKRKASYEKALKTLTQDQAETWKKLIGEPMTYNPHKINSLSMVSSLQIVRGAALPAVAPVAPVVPAAPAPAAPPAPPAPPKKDQ